MSSEAPMKLTVAFNTPKPLKFKEPKKEEPVAEEETPEQQATEQTEAVETQAASPEDTQEEEVNITPDQHELGVCQGNAYHKQVGLDKISRILDQDQHLRNRRMVLLVNRLTNEAVPVIKLHNHYYYRTRSKRGRFIWMRHSCTPLMMNDHHRDQWNAYFYFVDYQQMIEENLIKFGGDKVFTSDHAVTLRLNP